MKTWLLKVFGISLFVCVSIILFSTYGNGQLPYYPFGYQQYNPYNPYNNPYASNINPYLEDGYTPPPNLSNWIWTDPWSAYDPHGGSIVAVNWQPEYVGTSPYFQQTGYNPYNFNMPSNYGWNQPYNYGWNQPSGYGFQQAYNPYGIGYQQPYPYGYGYQQPYGYSYLQPSNPYGYVYRGGYNPYEDDWSGTIITPEILQKYYRLKSAYPQITVLTPGLINTLNDPGYAPIPGNN